MDSVEALKEKIEPLLQEESVELIDVSFRRQGKRKVFKILVDKVRPFSAAAGVGTSAGGITLNECAQLNRRISTLLDQENLIDGGFILEISSPGIDRPLVTRKDFLRCLGRMVRITTGEEFRGGGVHTGKIKRLEDDELTVETGEGECLQIPLRAIIEAKQVIKFR